MFGPIEVRIGERRLGPRDFGGVKPKQILELLLLARGHPVPKDRIAEALWGDNLPQNTGATIETYVSVLRRQLGPGIGRALVATETEAYRFEGNNVTLDLDEFEELADRAVDTADLTERRALLERALDLVRGEVLEDEPYTDWVERVRSHYLRRVMDARLAASEAALLAGEYRAGTAHAEAALEVDSLDERAYRAVMLAAYLDGRIHDVLRTYDRCAKVLMDELGVDPVPETEELLAAIRSHEDPTTLLAQLSGTALADDRSAVEMSRWDRDVEILLVEDNAADARLIEEVLKEGNLPCHLEVITDGETALDYLHARGPYEDRTRPDLVLLDLKLPKLDGREVLADVKGHDDLRRIPVIVLTTSSAERDILYCYDLQANSYISKPGDLDGFTRVVRSIEEFWPATATLPPA